MINHPGLVSLAPFNLLRRLGVFLIMLMPLSMLQPSAWGAAPVDHFTIEGYPGYVMAGVPFHVTITAYQDATNIATTFQGTADLKSNLDFNDTLRTIRPLTITFTNGIWTGEVTRFRADQYDGQNNDFYVEYETVQSPTGGMHVMQNSPNRLLIVAPGMTAYPGLNPDVWPDFAGADGQPSIQTAGTAITNVSFYLCDNYWNPVTSVASAFEDIQLFCSDPYPAQIEGVGAIGPGGLALSLSRGAKEVLDDFILYTVNGSSGQSVRVEKPGFTSYELGVNRNRIPVTSTTLNHFTITAMTNTTANVAISLTITGYDAYGNTVTSVPGTTSIELQDTQGTGYMLDPSYQGYTLSPAMASSEFATDGAYIGTLRVRRAAQDYRVRITNTSIGNTESNDFDISAGSAARYIVVMPGQTYMPGERFSGIWGRNGAPADVTANSPVNVSIVATDGYGNRVPYTEALSWSPTSHLAITDIGASVTPNPIQITNGIAYPSFLLTLATTAQDLTVPYVSLMPQSSGTFNVVMATPTVTATSTETPMLSPTPTPTVSSTSTQTPVFSPTATATFTPTSTQTSVFTFTHTSTASASPTPVITRTLTATTVLTPMATETPTRTSTQTPVLSATPTATQTPVFSASPTATMTPTSTQSPVLSATPSITLTITTTQTPEVSATPTATLSSTRTQTPTSSATPTNSITPTRTQTPLNSATPTVSLTVTHTQTPTFSATPTATITRTATPTSTTTLTSTISPTPTVSPTATASPTSSATPKGMDIPDNQVKIINNRLHPLRSGDPARIYFHLKESGRVSIRIYTATRGRLLLTLLDQRSFAAGQHMVEWAGKMPNGTIVASGIYIVQVEAPGINQHQRIAVIK